MSTLHVSTPLMKIFNGHLLRSYFVREKTIKVSTPVTMKIFERRLLHSHFITEKTIEVSTPFTLNLLKHCPLTKIFERYLLHSHIIRVSTLLFSQRLIDLLVSFLK